MAKQTKIDFGRQQAIIPRYLIKVAEPEFLSTVPRKTTQNEDPAPISESGALTGR